jgi:hypothetical protein
MALGSSLKLKFCAVELAIIEKSSISEAVWGNFP